MIRQSLIQNNINKQLVKENIPTSPTEVITGISRGFSKTKKSKEMYQSQLEFPEELWFLKKSFSISLTFPPAKRQHSFIQLELPNYQLFPLLT